MYLCKLSQTALNYFCERLETKCIQCWDKCSCRPTGNIKKNFHPAQPRGNRDTGKYSDMLPLLSYMVKTGERYLHKQVNDKASFRETRKKNLVRDATK